MELFKCLNIEVFELKKRNVILTPLGKIILDLNIEKESVHNTKSSNLYKFDNGGYITKWITNIFNAELLLCKPHLYIPAHMSVDNCMAGIWRVKAHSDINKCNFSAIWEDGYTWIDEDISSGENLECKIWNDSKISVAIGTEGEELLIRRGGKNKLLPQKLEKEITTYEIVEYVDNGIKVNIDKIKKGEIVQIQFIIAWGEESLPTWFAVDMSADEILKSQKCI